MCRVTAEAYLLQPLHYLWHRTAWVSVVGGLGNIPRLGPKAMYSANPVPALKEGRIKRGLLLTSLLINEL